MDSRKQRTVWQDEDANGNTLALIVRGDVDEEKLATLQQWIDRRRASHGKRKDEKE